MIPKCAWKSAFLAAAVLSFGLSACSDDEVDSGGDDAGSADASVGDAAAVECTVTAPTECVDPAPVYADVVPIIETHCYACHDGTSDNWPLTTYPHVAGWYAEIRSVMLDCTMPPPEARGTMTTAERELLLDWIRCGSKEF